LTKPPLEFHSRLDLDLYDERELLYHAPTAIHLVAISTPQTSRRMQDIQELLARRLGNTLLHRSLRLLALLTKQLLATDGLGIRVEAEEDRLVAKRVLLLGEWPYAESAMIIDQVKLKFTLLDGLASGT